MHASGWWCQQWPHPLCRRYVTLWSNLDVSSLPSGENLHSPYFTHADFTPVLGQTTVGTFSMVVSNTDPIFMFWFVISPTEVMVMRSPS
jgi:hypothetical protein